MAKPKTPPTSPAPGAGDDANPFASLLGNITAAPPPIQTAQPDLASPPEGTIDLKLPPVPNITQATFSDDPPLGWGEKLDPDPADALLQRATTIPATQAPYAGEPGRATKGPPVPALSDIDQRLDAEARERRRSLLEDALNAKLAIDREKIVPKVNALLSAPGSGASPSGASDPRLAALVAEGETGANDKTTKWVTRVQVTSAYQFDGRTSEAPAWIDRNWLAYDSTPPAGPALAIPGVGMVKITQWIVAQSVLNEDGSQSWEEIKVYDDQVFRSLYMQETAQSAAAKKEKRE